MVNDGSLDTIRMATKEEIIEELKTRYQNYRLVGFLHELIFWMGSGLSALCSALAGLSIVSEGAELTAFSKAFTALLAIVPAIWVAIDSTIRFRELSIHNYGVSTRLRSLYLKMVSNDLDEATRKDIEAYQALLSEEYEKFSRLLWRDTSVKAAPKIPGKAVEEIK